MKIHPFGKVWLSESGIKADSSWDLWVYKPLSPSNDEFFTNLVINLFIGTQVKPFTEIVAETSPNVIQKKTLLCITTSESTPCPPSDIVTLSNSISHFKFHLSLKCQKKIRSRICELGPHWLRHIRKISTNHMLVHRIIAGVFQTIGAFSKQGFGKLFFCYTNIRARL